MKTKQGKIKLNLLIKLSGYNKLIFLHTSSVSSLSPQYFICIPGAVLIGKLDYLVGKMKKTFHLQLSAEVHLSRLGLQSLSDCLTRL